MGHSLSSTNGQTLRVAFNEVKVLATPVEHFEAGVELVQKRLASSVEMVGHVKWTRR